MLGYGRCWGGHEWDMGGEFKVIIWARVLVRS